MPDTKHHPESYKSQVNQQCFQLFRFIKCGDAIMLEQGITDSKAGGDFLATTVRHLAPLLLEEMVGEHGDFWPDPVVTRAEAVSKIIAEAKKIDLDGHGTEELTAAIRELDSERSKFKPVDDQEATSTQVS